MDALELLKRDHDDVRLLFKRFESAENERESLTKAIAAALQAHSHIEESLFYPVLEEQKDQQLIAIVDKSLKEHQEMKSLAKDILRLIQDGPQLSSSVMELQRHVGDHFTEEENGMFPLVRQAIANSELERIGQALEVEKRTYTAGGVHPIISTG